MMPYIYLLLILSFACLLFGLYIKEYVLLSLGSMMVMILGISIIASGLNSISNFATEAFGIFCIGIGGYVLVRGSLENIRR